MRVINAALCSFGLSGKVFHAPFLSIHSGFKFYAVWERSKDLARQFYPDVKVFRTYEEMLADDTVELVIINTPSYSHYEYAKKALEAGKNIIVEKPFTATVAQGQELVDLAKKKNLKLSVFQNRRYDSDYKTVKKVLEEGSLGEILEAEIHYDRFSPALSPKAHKETPGPAVGVVYDLASHLIDQGISLFGMPHAVFADIFSMRAGSKVDDYMEILLYYPSFRVRLKSTYFAKEPQGFIIHGRNGSFIKSRADVQEPALQSGQKPGSPDWGTEPKSEEGILHFEKDGKQVREHIPTLQGNYSDYYNDVYNALQDKGSLSVTGQDGLNVIKIIEAAYQSNKEKKVIEL
ncbi:MAG: Gfo/Idh/MocA family oxidoreductase [Chitinophagaceae bacterium]